MLTSVGMTERKSPPFLAEISAPTKLPVLVERSVRLGNDLVFFFDGRQIADLIEHSSPVPQRGKAFR